jgi:hypothetical protein
MPWMLLTWQLSCHMYNLHCQCFSSVRQTALGKQYSLQEASSTDQLHIKSKDC